MRIQMWDATFCLLSSQTCHSKTWRCQTAQPLYSFVKYQFSKQDFLSSPRWSRRYEINITILGFSVNLIILLLGPSCLTSGHSVPDRAEREQHGKVLLANLAQIWSNLRKKSLNTSRKMSGTDSIRLYYIVYNILQVWPCFTHQLFEYFIWTQMFVWTNWDLFKSFWSWRSCFWQYYQRTSSAGYLSSVCSFTDKLWQTMQHVERWR